MAIDDNTSYELTGAQVKDLASKINAKADSSSLATVATSGSYADLSGTPTIPTKTSDLTNNGSDNTSVYVEADELATVATSGSYTDLNNKPTIPAAQVNSDWDANSGVAQILNKPTLATVATSGSYTDLTNKPTIPAAQVQSDWDQSDNTAVDFIKNKPNIPAGVTLYSGTGQNTDGAMTQKATTDELANKVDSSSLATVATSGDYTDLINTPNIPTVYDATLTIQRNSSTVASFSANSDTNATANITVPTDTSDLTNGAGYITGYTAGDHIDITSGTISAEDYVHSENPLAVVTPSSTLSGANITNASITADKFATGATLQLTMSTTDIGEGAALADNTLYGVYS